MKSESASPNASTVAYPLNRFLNKSDLAAALKVSPRTIETWRNKGILRPVKIGRVLRFDWEDVVTQLTKYRGGLPNGVEEKRF